MRQVFKAIIILFFAAWVSASCTIEHIDNGDLDGFWHFEQMDTLATGGRLDLRERTLFWAFQAKLMHTQGGTNKFYFRFAHEGNTLVITDPYLDHGHQDKEDGGDIPVDDPDLLREYGLQSLADTFYIEQLTSSTMVLATPLHRLHFTKF
ncbi:MAG: lipocalin-like domain-containing protein [Prevotella sp.]|nr:lipocalin-like domain-containing protein [Prevotella sp.]